MARKTNKVNFETSIAELQELVEKMERGDFTLEESVQQFERGVALARACQLALKDAEQKVQQLVKAEDGTEGLEPFEDDLKD